MTVRTRTLEEVLGTVALPGLDRNLFSSPEWLRVVAATYGTRFFVKYIEENGVVVSYIIYAVVKNFLEWKICVCSYCDYCDGYVRGPDDWRIFFEALRRDYPQYRIAIRNLRDAAAREAGVFQELSREYFHCLDVRGTLDDIWRRAHDSYKAAVNQSVRKGVTVRRCAKDELVKFYDSHLHVRKNKYRVFPQPYKFFDTIWEAYMTRGKGFLLGAYSPDGAFIGGNIYLVCGDTLYYKFNTSVQQALQFRPNNVLFWEGIRLAKELRLSFLDLGSSGLTQDGLVRFKDHVGAERHHIVHLGYHPPTYRFSQKRILRFLTRVFTLPWMPDVLLKWGSHIIYHYLA